MVIYKLKKLKFMDILHQKLI